MPNRGEISVPRNCSDPNTANARTELGRDQHEPAQDHAFHLERPRGKEIGRPLEAEAPNAERRQSWRTRDKAHVFVRSLPPRLSSERNSLPGVS